MQATSTPLHNLKQFFSTLNIANLIWYFDKILNSNKTKLLLFKFSLKQNLFRLKFFNDLKEPFVPK